MTISRDSQLDPYTDIDCSPAALVWDAGHTILAAPNTFPPERIAGFASKLIGRFLAARD